MGYAPALMQSRLRLFVALLLLAAAGIHPLIHVAAQDCPCVHGAAVTVAAPDLPLDPPADVAHAAYVSAVLIVSAAGELPARAPPAA